MLFARLQHANNAFPSCTLIEGLPSRTDRIARILNAFFFFIDLLTEGSLKQGENEKGKDEC